MKTVFLKFSVMAIAAGALFSCSEKNDEPDVPDTPELNSTGAYILCAGTYDGNNASLDLYDIESSALTEDVFATVNGRALGSNANDMIIHDSKIYIAVNNSATVEICDLSGKSLKTINLADEAGTPENPRCLAAWGDNVYVTLYDGYVARINANTMEIDGRVKVGNNPEGICVSGDKLYVANSGGYQPVPDNTLSVIDLPTFTATSTVEVTVNPNVLRTAAGGKIIVLSFGNFADIPNTLQEVDTATGSVKVITQNSQIIPAVNGSKVFYYTARQENWVVTESAFKSYDIVSGETETLALTAADGSALSNVYSLGVDPATDSLYVGTSDYNTTGEVYVFGADGKLGGKLAVSGISPIAYAFFDEK